MNDFLSHLSIKVVRPEGDGQLLCVCPFCEKEKFYINRQTGLYFCQAGSCQKKGNPWTLVKELMQLEPKEIKGLLESFQLQSGTGTGRTKEATQEAPKSPIHLKPGEVARMEEPDIDAFCETYGLDKLALRAVMGNLIYRHAKEPWALFQSFRPGQQAPTGIMRVHMNKELIKTSHGDEKYPQVYGSSHGLFGLRRIEEDKPKEVIFTEGWRDCVAATEVGYYAMASSGGASCWKDEWLPAFEGRKVHIIFDADKAGVKAAHRAAGRICTVTAEIGIVPLPFEIKENHGEDLYDWFTQGKK
ncbi:MAG: toprim domain-containing protein [Planctomycetes bacterium]|nr:toprim domain-containing protein [Planctomycetota bacterium]